MVAGGPLFTMESEQFPEVDHFVLNEAELTLPPFLADLAQGTAQRIYTTEDYADIRQSPTPLWRLADRRRYASMGLQFSRGCPFNCDFCNVTALLGHKPRTKSSAQILAELNGLYELGWRGRVFFVDDNLIGNKKYLKEELLPVLIEWRRGKTGMPFNTEASINLADDEELMRLMVAAGFDTVFVGIETPDDEGLAECNKKQNLNRDLVADVKRLQRAGLEVQGGFIVGFDSDTADDLRPPDRVHPAQRHRHRDGGDVAGACRHEAVRTAGGRGAVDWARPRAITWRRHQHRPGDESRGALRGLPFGAAAPLRARNSTTRG